MRPITPGLFTLVDCLNCGKRQRNYKSAGGQKKFCSRACVSAYARRDQACASCSGEIGVPKSHGRKYCSKVCHARGQRLSSGRAMRNEAVATYLRHAKARGLAWSLTDAEVDMLFAGNCHWCGEQPSNRRFRAANHGDFVYNGIDRVDNEKPYTSANCVSCCFTCNSMKRDFDQATFLRKATLIARKWSCVSQ